MTVAHPDESPVTVAHPDERFDERQADPAPRRGRPRHRTRRVVRTTAAVLVLAAAGAGTALVLAPDGGGRAGGRAASGLPPATAEVLRQTLKDTRSADARLGFGTERTAVGRLPGTLTRLPAPGAEITRGKTLYAVDEQPVVVLYGSLPAYRVLAKGSEGTDVRELEENLVALGYTGFTPDDEYTGATARAVRRWQDDLGLKETGTVEPGRVVFTAGAIRVAALKAEPGDQTGPGRSVLSYTGTARAVTAELDSADRRLARRGGHVEVTLPDGAVVRGTITEVAGVSRAAEGQKKAGTKIRVVVGLTDARARAAVRGYDEAGVHVTFTAATRENVLTVPVSALLALAGGGFGVEVVEGSTSTYVPVTTGLFAEGRVEISGTGVVRGAEVGMPE